MMVALVVLTSGHPSQFDSRSKTDTGSMHIYTIMILRWLEAQSLVSLAYIRLAGQPHPEHDPLIIPYRIRLCETTFATARRDGNR